MTPAAAPPITPELRARLRRRFRDELDPDVEPATALQRLVGSEAPLLDAASATELAEQLAAEFVGLGALEQFWSDPDVSDVLVNADGAVWLERGGVLQLTEVRIDADQALAIAERVLGHLGLRVDRSRPVADGRLADGSRFHVVIPPVSIDGPVLSIRRFAAAGRALDELADAAASAILRDAVATRRNIVVFGGTGSGKTTLLNALAGLVRPGERIVTVEDAAELRLATPHVVRLEARPPNGDGAGAVAPRDLVRAALRMRPDRIVVGEVRGPEAFDMVWAMSTGHEGSLSTCHAASATVALSRLETFVAMADADLPFAVARRQVRAAVDLLVGIRRFDDGRRGVVSIHRVPDDPDEEPPAIHVDDEVRPCR